jgi:hypothetical protein
MPTIWCCVLAILVFLKKTPPFDSTSLTGISGTQKTRRFELFFFEEGLNNSASGLVRLRFKNQNLAVFLVLKMIYLNCSFQQRSMQVHDHMIPLCRNSSNDDGTASFFKGPLILNHPASEYKESLRSDDHAYVGVPHPFMSK